MGRLSAFLSLGSWHRFMHIDAAQRRLRAEAFVRLASVALNVWLLPFERVIASAAVPVGGAAGVEASAVAEAVRWAAAVAPFRALCLQQGLACQVMLRRRGVDARLHYGVAMQDGRMEAHVWVSTGGTVVLGTEEARRFREVASFPA